MRARNRECVVLIRRILDEDSSPRKERKVDRPRPQRVPRLDEQRGKRDQHDDAVDAVARLGATHAQRLGDSHLVATRNDGGDAARGRGGAEGGAQRQSVAGDLEGGGGQRAGAVDGGDDDGLIGRKAGAVAVVDSLGGRHGAVGAAPGHSDQLSVDNRGRGLVDGGIAESGHVGGLGGGGHGDEDGGGGRALGRVEGGDAAQSRELRRRVGSDGRGGAGDGNADGEEGAASASGDAVGSLALRLGGQSRDPGLGGGVGTSVGTGAGTSSVTPLAAGLDGSRGLGSRGGGRHGDVGDQRG